MPELAGRVADAFEARVREQEKRWLSPLAVRSYETRGRAIEEEECGVRTPFQRDRDRIVHSKPFRRLKGKTQVFIDPQGDHYRTRMTHTLETTAISRVVARALRLNEDLTEAIGLGHDMGHTPFGHAGEDALDHALGRHFGADAGFRHHEHSYRIARGLNLTYEVCEGILTHTGEREPDTLEGKIVRIVDRVAYINHDIDDAVRDGRSPRRPTRGSISGATGSARIDFRSCRHRGIRRASTTSASQQRWARRAVAPRFHVRARLPPAHQARPNTKARDDRGDLRPPRRARRRRRQIVDATSP